MARQLRRELPEAAVTVLEKTARPLPDACHKVGESSVEITMHYWHRLGLRQIYMAERQLPKWGLRFYPGGGELPLHLRTEIGPCAEPPLKTYQLDRGRLESDLRGMIEDDGATLIEGAKVTAIELGTGGARHTVRYERDGKEHELRPRWVVAIKAARAAASKGEGESAGRLECQWQREQLPEAIRELVLDDQQLRNDICWSVFSTADWPSAHAGGRTFLGSEREVDWYRR